MVSKLLKRHLRLVRFHRVQFGFMLRSVLGGNYQSVPVPHTETGHFNALHFGDLTNIIN